jgi:hypothetical protein
VLSALALGVPGGFVVPAVCANVGGMAAAVASAAESRNRSRRRGDFADMVASRGKSKG